MNELAQRIDQRLKDLGLTPRQASLKAGLGTDGIRNVLRGRSKSPRVETMKAIATALDCDLEWLCGVDIPTAETGAMVMPADVRRETRPAMVALPQGRDLPVLGAARGGERAYFLSNGDLFEMTERPASLSGIDGAYAVYMVGESMEPRYHNGEVLYVHPFRPPERGKYVVVQLGPESGASDMEYLVKRYLGRAGGELVLEQYNPRGELRFPLTRVRAIHRIVGTKDD